MPESEAAIERSIQSAGLTAPRLTPADIDRIIVGETYTALPSGKVMVCELTLLNGFTVRGESACVSKANFNEEIGRRISRGNARDKVWELQGYLLQQCLYGMQPDTGPGTTEETLALQEARSIIAALPGTTRDDVEACAQELRIAVAAYGELAGALALTLVGAEAAAQPD